MAKTTWKNRIVGEGLEAPDQLLANPNNWRIHPMSQQQALAGVLDDVGWVQRIVVNRRTGHVVDGHLRVALAISREESFVPVEYVDLSEAEESLMLAVLDPISAMAGSDVAKYDQVLREIETSNVEVMTLLGQVAEKMGIGAKPVEFDGYEQKEPVVSDEVVIEIRCTREQLATIQTVLDEWSIRGLTVNIS